MKRFLLLLFALFPLLAMAYDFEKDGIYYYITSSTDLTVKVTSEGYSVKYSGDVTIPETVVYKEKQYSVTSIGEWAFSNCSGLTSLTIPNSVTSIGNHTFVGCSGLTSLTIPNSVTSIGDYAFYGCSGLTSLTIPNSVSSIGSSAFEGCSGLTSLSIPNSVSSIGSSAFEGCSGLTSLSIPNSVTGIGSNAFSGCSGLTSLTIPNSVTSIGSNAFSGCSGKLVVNCNIPDNITFSGNKFNEVVIGDDVTIIGSNAFSGCSGLTSVTIGNSVTSIGSSAFNGCSSVTSLTIPNSVTSIGSNAFNGCSSVTSLTIPNSVTSIGSRAFSDCSGKLVVNCNIPSVSYNSSSAFDGSKFNEVVIGDDVTSIGDRAFRYCSSITSLTIPNSVTSIGDYAFYGCSGVTSLTIPNSVTSIGSSAFEGCSGVTSVTIPNSVTSIGDHAFYGYTLKSLTIGAGVKTIGSSAFSKPIKTIWLTNTPPDGYANASGTVNYVSNNNYSNLKNVKVYQNLSSIFEVDGVKYVPVSISDRTCDAIDCIYDPSITTINIRKTVSYKNIAMNVKNINSYIAYDNKNVKEVFVDIDSPIEDFAFNGCTNIETVTLNGNIASIGESAFSGCQKLKEVTIPNTTNALYASAFKNCSSLTKVVLGSGLTSIEENTFSGCSSLPEIVIPSNISSVGNDVFKGCKSLAKVIIEDRNNALSLGGNYISGSGSNAKYNPLFNDCPLESVYIGGKIKYDTSSSKGYSPFYRNTSLQTVVITDTEEEIYNYEFYGCSNLKNVQIGDGVKKIGDYAFSGCSSLTEFDFGSGLQSIGKEAFSDCTALTRIGSRAAVPPTCGSQALDDINKWECTLYVPQSSIDAYKAADQWKEFLFVDVNTEGGSDEPKEENNKIYYTAKNQVFLQNWGDNGDIETIEHTFENGEGCITFSKDVTHIGMGEFSNSRLTSIKLPETVTSIGAYAFMGCYELEKIIIPDGVTEIENEVFFNCYRLAEINLPQKIKAIKNGAFYRCEKLIIDLPDEVEIIGSTAFYGCTSLTSVAIPNSVKEIGSSAFEGCTGLTSINIPSNVSSIGNYFIDGCSSLVQLTVDANNKVYDSRNNCNALIETSTNTLICTIKNSVIPNDIENIADGARIDCSGLSELIISDKIKSIGTSAFEHCDNVTSIFIPSSVEKIESNAFDTKIVETITVDANNRYYDSRNNCNAIIETSTNTIILGCVSTNIPNTVTRIGTGAFANSNLASISLPESITSIGVNAFYRCEMLESMYLPESVTSIEIGAFASCSALKIIYIPQKVKKIEQVTFSYCQSLEKVLFHKDSELETIEDAFNGCVSLAYFHTPNKVKTIRESFLCCALEEFVIPESVTILMDVTRSAALKKLVCLWKTPVTNDCFKSWFMDSKYESMFDEVTLYVPYGCKAAYMADRVWGKFKNIVEGASYEPASENNRIYYSADEKIELPSWVTWWGTNGSINPIINHSFSEGTGCITFENDVTIIPSNAFNSAGFKTIALPKTVSQIEGGAFNTSALESIELPENLSYIEGSAFMACNNLKSIKVDANNPYFDSRYDCNAVIETATNAIVAGCLYTKIPEDVTGIKRYAFFDLQMESVFIPDHITKIEGGAFALPSLRTITVDTNNKMYDSRNNCNAIIETSTNTLVAGCVNTIIPEEVSIIGEEAFKDCHGLKSITLHEGITAIKSGAFSGCIELETINLPESLVEIGVFTFLSCSKLSEITIPKNVKELGYAFCDCSNLTKITCLSTVPPHADEYTFIDWSNYENYYTIYEKATLYVPTGSKAAYEADEIWGSFKNIVEMANEEDAIEEIMLDQNSDLIYNLDGIKVENGFRGIGVRNGKKVMIK